MTAPKQATVKNVLCSIQFILPADKGYAVKCKPGLKVYDKCPVRCKWQSSAVLCIKVETTSKKKLMLLPINLTK
jgi:hypothetical protein